MTEVTPDSVAQVLEDAADHIEQKGWCQGEYEADGGAVCAVGALDYATGVSARGWLFGPAHRVFQRRLGLHIENWNDAPERTAHEVIDELKLAAKDIRNGEIVL